MKHEENESWILCGLNRIICHFSEAFWKIFVFCWLVGILHGDEHSLHFRNENNILADGWWQVPTHSRDEIHIYVVHSHSLLNTRQIDSSKLMTTRERINKLIFRQISEFYHRTPMTNHCNWFLKWIATTKQPKRHHHNWMISRVLICIILSFT